MSAEALPAHSGEDEAVEAAKEAEQAFRRIGPGNEQDTTLGIFDKIESWAGGNQTNAQNQLVQDLQSIAQGGKARTESAETLHPAIGSIVENTRHAINDIVNNPRDLETTEIQARLEDLHTEVDKLIQELLPEGMKGMAPSIRSAEDIRTASQLAKQARIIGMDPQELVDAAMQRKQAGESAPSWEAFAGIGLAEAHMQEARASIQRMLDYFSNERLSDGSPKYPLSLKSISSAEVVPKVIAEIGSIRQERIGNARETLSIMGVHQMVAPNIYSLLGEGPPKPENLAALSTVLREDEFNGGEITQVLQAFVDFEGKLIDSSTPANVDAQNQFRDEIRHILTEQSRARIRAGTGEQLPFYLRNTEFTNLEPEIRTAINETKTALFVTRGGKEQDMREVVALASGESVPNPSEKTRQFIADLLNGQEDDFSSKENLQAILGKKRVNADADKTRAAVYQAAWYEIAAAAKTILDGRQPGWQSSVMDGKGMQLLPPGLSETSEKAGTFEEKISSYEGILVGFGIKYFAVATFLTNLMVSAQHGDFENPYLFASGAALYGAAKVFDDDIVAQWMHPESKTFTALANIDSGPQMDALRLVFADKDEMAAMELLDLSNEDGWEKWVDERDEVADKANEGVKFAKTPNYPAAPGVFGQNLHEISPTEMKNFDLRVGKGDDLISSRMDNLQNSTEQNRARYLAVKFLFDEGMTNEDLRVVHQSAVVLAANNRRMQPRSQPR